MVPHLNATWWSEMAGGRDGPGAGKWSRVRGRGDVRTQGLAGPGHRAARDPPSRRERSGDLGRGEQQAGKRRPWDGGVQV